MTQIPIAADGLLAQFAHAHMIGLADFHVARRTAALAREDRAEVLLALALCIRTLREGSVCLDLSSARHLTPMQETDDGTVEALEFTATAKTPGVLGVPLKDLRLKKGVLLAAIVRHGKTIIPGGLTAIEEGDSLVVVTRTTGLHDLKGILAD